jgi:hypothetical protein
MLLLAACSGDKGVGGEDGTDGTNGTNGMNGVDGTDGTNGMDGVDGTDGMDGMDGVDGMNGMDGMDGADGDAGVDGMDGMDGTDGESGIIDRTKLTGDLKVYDMPQVGTSGISGQVRFAKFMDGSTLVTIKVNGTLNGIHAAHVHINSVVEGGSAAITLNSVDGFTGLSETVVRQQNNGTPITYDQLLTFDGHVNVHVAQTGGAVCAGDIGGNELTGDTESYPLFESNGSGITGTATLAERNNGNTLVTLTVVGNLAGTDRAAHFHPGTVAVPGTGALITLTDVSAATNTSVTNVRIYDSTSPVTPSAAVTYDQLLALNAYLNVHMTDVGGAAIASGDVGVNELTGDSILYTLAEANTSGITGSATLEERKDGTTLVTLVMVGNLAGIDRAAHFHPGSVANPGAGALITLTDVAAATNRSATEVDIFDSTSPVTPSAAVTYDQLLALDAYLNVHITDTGGNAIAQGDVGSNAP